MSDPFKLTTNQTLRAVTIFGSMAVAMMQQPEVFSPDVAGFATASVFGLLMEGGREICMSVGRLGGRVLPPSAEKISKDPSLVIGLALYGVVLCTSLPHFGRKLSAITKPVFTTAMHVIDWATGEIESGFHHRHVSRGIHHYHS